MARAIKDLFVNELLNGTLNPLLSYVQKDDTLNLELRGKEITVYYRGGAILTVKQDSYKFVSIDPKYHSGISIISPTIANIREYIPIAKQIIDFYVSTVKNHLGEKDIQQQIARENNYSPNSLDTDYFVIDTEYQDLGRFDIVALRWDSVGSIRKLPKSFLPILTIFEVKQGYKAISNKSGMNSHIQDFKKFLATKNIDSFKNDMIKLFKQKRTLGIIRGLEKNKEVSAVAKEIDFVFILANYKHQSTQLRTALNTIVNCRLIFANYMGYGLYARNIVSAKQFTALFL